MTLTAYRRRADRIVTAVQIRLDSAGIEYRKWGGPQRADPGDWLVDNEGDVYTVDAQSFASTYEQIAPGQYRKCGTVWAEEASGPGEIATREGKTSYVAGDYIVYNDQEGRDGYAIARQRFESLYEPVVS